MDEPNKLSHFSDTGRARMVDVSAKPDSLRSATASGILRMNNATLLRVRAGTLAKGNVLAVADVGAVIAAKHTPFLIPMCHPVALSGVEVDFREIPACSPEGLPGIRAQATARCTGATGVEMEALSAVSGALLTLYDMCKAIDRGMRIENIQLEEKTGGKSGAWRRGAPAGDAAA